ncbi:hypothetical protein CFIMG_004569RAa [Ceratocystis fimbriata CBS 114723]|uniref:Uncharacterized protein n=1 Tax=Ceratocystis fimbriata CBS 114723 TaxID=1035309 RepID=A0A2C5WZQ6_9PEZI|nr:hypothetical protein CFIMG_004569RAa [Ceratocystis fimbriata CBS 114723]
MPSSNSNGTGNSLFMKLPFLRTSNSTANNRSNTTASSPSSPSSASAPPATAGDANSHSPTSSTPAAATSSWTSSSLSWNIPLSPSSVSSSTSSARTAPRTRPRKGSLRKVALSRGAAQRREARDQFVIGTQLSNTPTGIKNASTAPDSSSTISGNEANGTTATSSDSGPSPRSSTESESTTPWPAFEDMINSRGTGLGVSVNSYTSTDDDDDDALHIKRKHIKNSIGTGGQPRSPSSSSATATPSSSTQSRMPNSVVSRKKTSSNSSNIQHLLPQELHVQQHHRNKSKSSKGRGHIHSQSYSHSHSHSQSLRSVPSTGITGSSSSAMSSAKPKTNPSPLSNASVPPASAVVIPLPDEEWNYSETAWWGWIILITTWIVFVVGIGSCFGVWSWAWDVGTTPYAPPELEDDPTLPITGYYPALIILSGVMAWVWVAIAWMGMKYFRHAKISGD